MSAVPNNMNCIHIATFKLLTNNYLFCQQHSKRQLFRDQFHCSDTTLYMGMIHGLLLSSHNITQHHLSSISNSYLSESVYWSLVFHIISSLGHPHSDYNIFKAKDADGLKTQETLLFPYVCFITVIIFPRKESCSMLFAE